MLDTIVSLILIALVTADLVLMSRSNAKLREQLLEIATQRAAQMSVHAIKIECDNSQAIASLEEVQRVIDHVGARLQDIERRTAAIH
jgi:hypothetical protein